MLHTSNFFPSI